MATVSSNVVSQLFQYKVMRETEVERMEREDRARAEAQARGMQLRHGGELAEGDEEEAAAKQSAASTPPPAQRRQVVAPQKRETPKIGRNDLCPCGSGLKFKKCHGEALGDDEGDAGGDDATA